MNRHLANLLTTVSLAAPLFAPPAFAGLRAWEPSDYVQDGLVLNFDGIRNAGADVAHNPGAGTWVNLGSAGGVATFNSTADGSEWTVSGYTFGGASYATLSTTVSLTNTVTIQVVSAMTFDTLKGTASSVSWPMFIGGETSAKKDACNLYFSKSANNFTFKNVDGGNANFAAANWDQRYLNAIRNGDDKYIFSSVSRPASATVTGSQGDIGDITFHLGSAASNTAGTDGFNARYIKGEIKAIRLYDRVLSNDELAQNRALDEIRFFTGIPVTNAVVATSVSGAEGVETAGAYAVDEDGHTFRASPTAVIDGVTYACTGCTVAAWDDATGDWGAAETRDGVFAVAVAPGDKVKITWQWEAATGALDANPYVTDGLVLHYDGIWNAGLGVHDAAATVWKDLSATGNDADFVSEATGGGWLDNAYNFETNGYFITQSVQDFGDDNTIQAVLGKPYTHQSSTWPFIVGSSKANNNFYSLYPSANNNVALNVDGITGLDWSSRANCGSWGQNYVTAMMHETNSVVFQTTTIPAFKEGTKAYTAMGARYWTIGAPHTTSYSSAADRLARRHRVPFHAIRVYSKLLSEDELAHNRAVDEARFFGAIPASNAVIVASAIAGLEGREPAGLYFPDGWTFSAGSATNTVRGIGWTCAGYQLQTWDAESGTWSAQTSVLRNGASAVEYTPPPSASFATVRLTWLWRPVSGIRTAADYALADYATGGTQLHLDGIEHGSAEWVWADLSGNGRDATYNGSKNGTSHWTGDGFFCNSNAVFNTAASFSLGRHYTMQVLADASNADHTDPNRSAVFAMPSAGWGYGGIYYKGDGNKNVYHRTDSVTSAAWNDMAGLRETAHMTYLTGLRDGTKVALVSGTSYPATTRTYTGEGVAWYVTTGWLDGTRNDVAPAATWRIGASTAGGGADALYGTVKSVRLYDRMLSEDELAWNRSVDSARFFGALATTNVVVVKNEYSGLADDTAYQVFGPTTFEAAVSGANFVRVKMLRQDGTWGDTRSVEGAFYAYDPATDGTVMIEFRKTNPFVIIVR